MKRITNMYLLLKTKNIISSYFRKTKNVLETPCQNFAQDHHSQVTARSIISFANFVGLKSLIEDPRSFGKLSKPTSTDPFN